MEGLLATSSLLSPAKGCMVLQTANIFFHDFGVVRSRPLPLMAAILASVWYLDHGIARSLSLHGGYFTSCEVILHTNNTKTKLTCVNITCAGFLPRQSVVRVPGFRLSLCFSTLYFDSCVDCCTADTDRMCNKT